MAHHDASTVVQSGFWESNLGLLARVQPTGTSCPMTARGFSSNIVCARETACLGTVAALPMPIRAVGRIEAPMGRSPHLCLVISHKQHPPTCALFGRAGEPALLAAFDGLSIEAAAKRPNRSVGEAVAQ